MTAEESLDKALKLSGEYLVNETKKQLTANKSVKTGTLRNSITYEVNGNELTVYTPIVYGIWVEFGTGLFAVNGDGRQEVPWHYQTPDGEWHSTKGSHPKPFFYNTFQNNKAKVEEIILKSVGEALK